MITTKTKLKLCDWSLLFLTIAILASGLQLEINPYGQTIWVWLHIIIGTAFVSGTLWHLKLHHKPHIAHTHGKKHHWLGSFFMLTLISGVIATVHWSGTYEHSTIGGIHGKLGFLMIIAVAIHVKKHIRFYRKQPQKNHVAK